VKFGYLILIKIIKFAATIYQILRLKCTGAPRHRWGLTSALSDPLPDLRGLLVVRREENWEGVGGEGRKKRRE